VRIGIISDTHGLLRPEALRALAGMDHLIHAGDVGRAEILAELGQIAPVSAVRGNVDTQAWALELPETLRLSLGGVSVFVIHDRGTLMPSHGHLSSTVVVFGHSHKAMAEERHGVLWLNPGSAGPRRFRLPVTVAILDTDGLKTEIIPLL
jgi:uncharacterized protein